jgi:hypothetical protein
MNGVLKATAQTVSKATLYRTAAGLAVGSAAIALAIAALLRPSMGAVFGYLVWPFLAALVVWAVAGISRLRLIGFLPGQPNDDDFIPRTLQPWIRFWLLSRIGLLVAMLVLLLAVLATAVAGKGASYCVEALVYVTVVRMFMDLVFGAAFNLGIITRRRGAA